MDNYIQALIGISYADWCKLEEAVDQYFRMKKRELDGQIQLSESETINKIIRLQFGQMLD